MSGEEEREREDLFGRRVGCGERRCVGVESGTVSIFEVDEVLEWGGRERSF